jgi:lipopolysaccharide/colanic/teichoic acid biosynthesis glycosyltransferase
MTLQRSIDIAVAASALVFASPLLLLIAWLIRLDDGGPVLFTQTRVGANTKPFRIYKFRTMRDGAPTRVGRWLRQTGLDELPQLVNMLRGEMSLIGPRPLTREDVERLGWNDDAHAIRWSVRPGIIGLAQLYAGRGKRLSWFLDLTYVRDRRLALDLGIFAATAVIGVVGKRRVRRWLRAYRRRRISMAAPRPQTALARPALVDRGAWPALPR